MARRGERIGEAEAGAVARSGKPSGKVLAVLGAFLIGMVALLLARGMGGGDAQVTPEVAVTATLPAGAGSAGYAGRERHDAAGAGECAPAPVQRRRRTASHRAG